MTGYFRVLKRIAPDLPMGSLCTLVSVATTDEDSRFVFLAVDTFQRVNNKRSPVYESSWNYSPESEKKTVTPHEIFFLLNVNSFAQRFLF